MTEELKRCLVNGCDARHRAKGFCEKHYKYERVYGVLADHRKNDVHEYCKIAGCSRLKDAAELCSKHYRRLQRHGDAYYVGNKGRKPDNNFLIDLREERLEVPDVIQEQMQGRDFE